ncbi:hypothetical protein [Paenibacillus amylolyticus]|nr:hypothetical protein [Paenibacillus amylolyticus]
MMRWIEEHFEDEMRLDQMAADVHLSKSYASCVFHQEIDSNIELHHNPEVEAGLLTP